MAVQATEDPTSVPQNATIYETPGKTTNRNVSPIKCAIEVLSDIFKQIRHYREMMQGDTFASSPSIEDISIIQQHIHQIKRTVIDLVFANSHLKGNTSSNYSFLLHYVSSQDPRTGRNIAIFALRCIILYWYMRVCILMSLVLHMLIVMVDVSAIAIIIVNSISPSVYIYMLYLLFFHSSLALPFYD